MREKVMTMPDGPAIAALLGGLAVLGTTVAGIMSAVFGYRSAAAKLAQDGDAQRQTFAQAATAREAEEVDRREARRRQWEAEDRARVEEQRQRIEKSMEDYTRVITEQYDALAAEVGPLRTRVAGLEAEIGPLRARAAALEDQIYLNDARIAQLQGEVEGLTVANHAKDQEIAQLRQRNTILEADLADVRRRLNVYESGSDQA